LTFSPNTIQGSLSTTGTVTLSKPAGVGGLSVSLTGNAAATPVKVKLGSSEFSEIESSAGDQNNQADAKYFHAFQNGACYEFALGIQTTRDADADIAQVDRQQVFNRLKRILTTVKIEPIDAPATDAATPSAAPENLAISQK